MPNKKLNIVFAGTPDFSAQILKSLLDNSDINITAVYTQPDRQSGRGKKITPSEVKQVILDYNDANPDHKINIEQPLNFRKANPERQKNLEILQSYQPDLIVVVAYGLILPQAVIDIPKYGCINIHTSLLPRWRGAAPIQRAILSGDQETGVTIQRIDTGLDTGDIIAVDKCSITRTDTTLSLTDKLLELSKPLLRQVLELFKNNSVEFLPQKEFDNLNNSLVTYAHKLEKEESLIDFNKSANYIDRQIRALNPWPGTKIKINEHDFIKVGAAEIITNNQKYTVGSIIQSSQEGLLIQCGENQLLITQLQFSGGKMMSVRDALNGKFKNLLQVGSTLLKD